MSLAVLPLLLFAAASTPRAPGHPLAETLRSACRPLCPHDASAQEVGQAIGRITFDDGAPAQVEVKPTDVLFSEADVLRDGITQNAVAVWFYVADGRRLSVSALTALFGDIEDTHRRTASGEFSLLFKKLVDAGGDCVCRLGVEVQQDGKRIENGAVTKVMVSRADR